MRFHSDRLIRLRATLCALFVLAFALALGQPPPLSTVPANPVGTPVVVSGSLYGTVVNGGTYGYGAVWKYSPSTATFSILYSFDGTNGASPYGKLVEAGDGYLYGTTQLGGIRSPYTPVPYGHGGAFRVRTDGTRFTFYPIPFSTTAPTDYGYNPDMGLVEDPVGRTKAQRVLYGVTKTGGANDTGTIYKLVISENVGYFTKLYEFPALVSGSNTMGANPWCELVLQTTTNTRYLFGTAFQGGNGGYGTVFNFSWAGATTIPTSGTIGLTTAFTANTVWNPAAGLILTTQPSGNNLGTMWGTTPSASNYGSTNYGLQGGGAYSIVGGGLGVSIVTQLTDMQFLNRGIQGGLLSEMMIRPNGALLLASDGYLYGTSLHGDHLVNVGGPGEHPVAYGSIFRFATTSVPSSTSPFTLVWSFDADATPALSQYPWSGLVEAPDGYIYGVTAGMSPVNSPPVSNGALYRFPVGTVGQVTLIHQF